MKASKYLWTYPLHQMYSNVFHSKTRCYAKLTKQTVWSQKKSLSTYRWSVQKPAKLIHAKIWLKYYVLQISKQLLDIWTRFLNKIKCLSFLKIYLDFIVSIYEKNSTAHARIRSNCEIQVFKVPLWASYQVTL